MEKDTISSRDYEIMKNGALSAGWVEDVIEKHKLLRGKSCSDDDKTISDYGVKFVYDLFNEASGRTIVYNYNEGTQEFFESKYLSDYYKYSIKELLKDDNLDNEKLLDILNCDKDVNDMSEEDIKLLYSAIKDHYSIEENNEYNVSNYFISYLYKLNGEGPTSYLKHNIPASKIASRIMWTSGLNDRASYYSGRGVNYSDLGVNNLVAMYEKLLRLDVNYAFNFAKMVCLMKTLGATEFINTFFSFAKNGFSTDGLFFKADGSNCSFNDAYGEERDVIAFATLMSSLSKGDDEYQLRASQNMKRMFLRTIKDYVDKIDSEGMKLLLISAGFAKEEDFIFDENPFKYHL